MFHGIRRDHAAAFRFSSIGQIAVTVTGLDRAVAFYRDTLGMKFLFQVPNLAFFDCDGVRLMLSHSAKPFETDGFVVYFKVPEIQQAHRALAERGVAFEGRAACWLRACPTTTSGWRFSAIPTGTCWQ